MNLGSGRSSGRMAPLNAWVMAIALALAAFAGGGLGLVWQSSSFAEEADEETDQAAEEAEEAEEDS